MDRISSRVLAAEEFLKNLVDASLSEFEKGVWVGLVRSTLNDMAD